MTSIDICLHPENKGKGFSKQLGSKNMTEYVYFTEYESLNNEAVVLGSYGTKYVVLIINDEDQGYL